MGAGNLVLARAESSPDSIESKGNFRILDVCPAHGILAGSYDYDLCPTHGLDTEAQLSRHPVRFTQADLNRVLRVTEMMATRHAVEIMPDGVIRITPIEHTSAPSPTTQPATPRKKVVV
jgi:hypothetical protein